MLSNGFIGYSGKYEIFEDKIVHHVEMSFIPNWIGNSLDRFYELDNENLILRSIPEDINDIEHIYRIIWEKI